jgi:hypothetical protein
VLLAFDPLDKRLVAGFFQRETVLANSRKRSYSSSVSSV